MPRHKFNRIQTTGVAFIVVGVATAVGILILNSFHPIDSNRRAGFLNESEMFVLAGAVAFLIGWIRRRRKTDDSSRE